MAEAQEVFLHFYANTKQAIREIDRLNSSQGTTAKGTRSLGDVSAAAFAKAAAAAGVAVVAYKALTSGMEHLQRRTKLMADAGRLDIESLAKASGSLLTNMQALELAAKLNNGAFKVTQDQLNLAGQAAVILGQKFGDTEKALGKVTQALVEGNVEALKEYGIVTKGVASNSVAGFNANISKMNDLLKENAGFASAAGTEVDKVSVKWQNALDTLMTALGEIGKVLVPLVDLLATLLDKLVSGISKAAKVMGDFAEETTNQLVLGTDYEERETSHAARMKRSQVGSDKRKSDAARRADAQAEQTVKTLADLINAALESSAVRDYLPERWGKSKGKSRAPGKIRVFGSAPAEAGPSGSRPEDFSGGSIDAAIGGDSIFGGDFEEKMTARIELQNQLTESYKEFAKAHKAIRTEQEKLADGYLRMAEAALSTETVMLAFTDNVGMAFEQVGAGAMSMGEALRSIWANTIADVLKMAAKEMFARATASALTGNFAGALGYTAAGAGLMAASGAMRRGGDVSRATPARPTSSVLPGSASGAIGGGGGGGQNREVIVINNNPFDDNPREARRRVAKLLERAAQEQGNGRTVVYA